MDTECTPDNTEVSQIVKRGRGRPKGTTKDVLAQRIKEEPVLLKLASGKIGKTRRDIAIAKLKAKGHGYGVIAKQVGLTKSRVQNICHRDDVKAVIEAEQARLATFVPQAVKNMEHWIEKATKTHDPVDKKIGYDATKELLQSTGILQDRPSHLVQVLYQENTTVISPIIKGLLEGFMEKINAQEVIDAEFTDVKS